MSAKSNLFTKFIDPIGFFRKGSGFQEGLSNLSGGNKGGGDSSSAGGGGNQTPPNVADAKTKEDEKKKRIGRSALVLTSPQGDLSPASTASGKILGN